nr:hypothetical protein [Tanacetum cinerariifolium]
MMLFGGMRTNMDKLGYITGSRIKKAIKASKHTSRLQHQSGGSSKGVGLRLEVPDEPSDKSTNLDEGAGSTDDEEYLLAYKDEKPEDIPWQSTDDEEFENNDEEDNASIDIEKTNERTDTDVEDQVKSVAEMNIIEETVEEITNRDEEQKDDEELKAEEEQKGDDQAGDEQLVVHVSTTQKETPSLLQSTSNHFVSSNFGNKFIKSPNSSLIGTILENAKAEINSLLDIQIQQDVPNIQQELFHAVKVSIIPEKKTQQPQSTPPAPLLPATEIQSAHVPNTKVVKSVVKRFTELERAVKELKQAYHSATMLALIRSQEPSVVKEYIGSSLSNAFRKKRDRVDDQDEDPLNGSNQGKKTKKRRENESESSKGKYSARTSISGKSVTAKELVEEPVFEIASEERSRYGYLKEIVVRGADYKIYKFKEGDFLNLHIYDIKDMLLIAQNKLFNLDDDVIVDFVTALQLVSKILHKRLLNIKFGYNKAMPLREWTEKDKKHTGIMVNKIHYLLPKQIILRSLEVLVGDIKTKTDKQRYD